LRKSILIIVATVVEKISVDAGDFILVIKFLSIAAVKVTRRRSATLLNVAIKFSQNKNNQSILNYLRA
jgi:hypothetical protein